MNFFAARHSEAPPIHVLTPFQDTETLTSPRTDHGQSVSIQGGPTVMFSRMVAPQQSQWKKAWESYFYRQYIQTRTEPGPGLGRPPPVIPGEEPLPTAARGAGVAVSCPGLPTVEMRLCTVWCKASAPESCAAVDRPGIYPPGQSTNRGKISHTDLSLPGQIGISVLWSSESLSPESVLAPCIPHRKNPPGLTNSGDKYPVGTALHTTNIHKLRSVGIKNYPQKIGLM